MPKFVLNRNYTMATTHGHVINFIKGQPTDVPPQLVNDCVAIGADPVDGKVDVLGPEDVVVIPPSNLERRAALFDAFAQLEARNGRTDFTAQGYPSVKALEKLTGLEVDNKERDATWDEYRVAKAEEK